MPDGLDSKVHEEINNKFDLTPDCIRQLFSGIKTKEGVEVSEAGIKFLFKQANIELPDSVIEANRQLYEAYAGPGLTNDWLIQLSGWSDSIQTLYILADVLEREELSRIWATKISKHGDAKKVAAEVEAEIAAVRGVKNLLRNMFYLLTRAASSAQSILKTEAEEWKNASLTRN